jgi:hypothetical protein
MLSNTTVFTPGTLVFNTLDYTAPLVLSSNPLTTEIEYLSGHVVKVPTSALLDEEEFNKQKEALVRLLEKRLNNIQTLNGYYTDLRLQKSDSV